MSDIYSNEDVSKFQMARISALDLYSVLEFSLSQILDELLNSPVENAGSIILFRVTNTRTRYAIIEKMIRETHDGFHKPWSVIERWLGGIDGTRNSLVHWGLSYAEYFDENGVSETLHVRLVNPKGSASPLTLKDIDAFRQECADLINIAHYFTACFIKDDDGVNRQPLRDKFLQLTRNQTPKGFLSSLTNRERGGPPPPSLA